MTLFSLPAMIRAWCRPLPPVLEINGRPQTPLPRTPWFRPGTFFIALRIEELSR